MSNRGFMALTLLLWWPAQVQAQGVGEAAALAGAAYLAGRRGHPA